MIYYKLTKLIYEQLMQQFVNVCVKTFGSCLAILVLAQFFAILVSSNFTATSI